MKFVCDRGSGFPGRADWVQLPRMRLRAILILGLLAIAALVGWTAIPRLLPHILSWYRPDIIFQVPTTSRRIYLTIDDAPSINTPRILEVLRKHQVPATFFVIASRVGTPEQLEKVVTDGHSLGNHLRTTRACSTLSPDDFSRIS